MPLWPLIQISSSSMINMSNHCKWGSYRLTHVVNEVHVLRSLPGSLLRLSTVVCSIGSLSQSLPNMPQLLLKFQTSAFLSTIPKANLTWGMRCSTSSTHTTL